MMKRTLFIDFDGVICDSVDECFVSSWLAYAEYTGITPSSVPLSDYALFKSYRPLIRRGADYLLLQLCINREIPLSSQADFDAQEEAMGEAGMDEFHRRFYKARSGLLESDREYWLDLHRIYHGTYDPLVTVADCAWILTTKEVSFVYEILLHNEVRWDKERIICSGKQRKLDVIAEMLGDGQAIFIDDQIDHFSGNTDDRISCFLAAWGYVQPQWLRENVPVLTVEGFVQLVRDSS